MSAPARARRPQRQALRQCAQPRHPLGKEVNGDRSAKLRLEKVGDNGMRLTTIDTDPATGKSVVISEINLRRL